MATTIGILTISGNDLGNNPQFYDTWINIANNTNVGGGGGQITMGTISDVMDYILNAYSQSYTGSITYTIDGPNNWNTGVDTIVTITFTDVFYYLVEVKPYYIILLTESYVYPFIWQTSQPVTPTLCNECQFIQLNQCGADSFYLNLGLSDGSYTSYFADNTSGVIWEQTTWNAASQGGLQVYQWSATAGMFNTYSFYTLTIKDSNGAPVSWTVDGVEYTCATLTFKTTVNVTD